MVARHVLPKKKICPTVWLTMAAKLFAARRQQKILDKCPLHAKMTSGSSVAACGTSIRGNVAIVLPASGGHPLEKKKLGQSVGRTSGLIKVVEASWGQLRWFTRPTGQLQCGLDPKNAQVEKVQMVDNPDQSSIWLIGHDRESFYQFVKAFTDAW